MRRAPGVMNASAVSAMPLHDVGAAGALPFNVEGQQPPPTEDPLADVRIVAPGYFETMKIKLLAGRFLDERDARCGAAHERDQRDDGAAILSGSRARSAASSRIRTARAKWSAWSATCTTRDSISDPRSRSTCRCGRARRPAWRWWRGRSAIRSTFANTIQRVIWEVDPGTADLRAEHDGPDPRARRVPAAPEHDAAGAVCAGGAAARRARHLRRAVVFGVAADERDRPAHGARRVGRQHRGDDRAQQRGDGRHRRRRSAWSPRRSWRARWRASSTASGRSICRRSRWRQSR